MLDNSSDGLACRLECMTRAEAQDQILGITVETKTGERFFLPRKPGQTDSEVEHFMNRLLLAADVSVAEDRLQVDGQFYTHLVVEETRESIGRSGQLAITGLVNIPVNLEVIKDEGSSEKREWRLQMFSFASNAFGKHFPAESQIALMPGASDTESVYWQNLGFKLPNMVMVEGDKTKCRQLEDKLEEKKPKAFVSSYFGREGSGFVPELQTALEGQETAVLSLDTESHFTPQLYKDLLAVLEPLEIGRDLVVSLNIVGQRDDISSQEAFLEQKTGEPYKGQRSPRTVILEQLPNFLLTDLERDDLKVKTSHVLAYRGEENTRMESVFVHFRKK